MAEKNSEELPFDQSDNANSGCVDTDPNPIGLTEAEKTFLIEQARIGAATSPAADADDDNYTADFKPAHVTEGEILLPVGDILEWDYHLRRHSPMRAEHASALALSASDPRALRPIEVLEKDGLYYVMNGRFILAAIREAHPDDLSIMVRAIVFPGTEEEAVVAMCDDVLGSAVATKMEMAHGLLSLQRACGISQMALAERYPSLTVHKVSRMLIAARLQEDVPVLFDILEAPHKAPISYGVQLKQALKDMPGSAVQDILNIAQEAAGNGTRFKPNEALEFLGALSADDAMMESVISARPKQIAPVESDEILGHDDKPVGARERLSDNVERLRLPNVIGMSLVEREAAADAFIAEIRRHFGLA